MIELLRDARVYDLEQPRYPGAPVLDVHEPGYTLYLHRHHGESEETRSSASALVVATEHCGTHIDALCHQAENGRLCDGTQVGPEIQSHSGISHLDAESISPIICRGILVDIERELGAAVPEVIELDLFKTVLANRELEPTAGDAVLVRTGSGTNYGDPASYASGPGIDGRVSEWLARRSPSLVGADNIAWDVPGRVDPDLGTTLPGHVHLICRNGIHIIENLALEQLAAAEVREFTFICTPLKMRGATGSPVRPLALV